MKQSRHLCLLLIVTNYVFFLHADIEDTYKKKLPVDFYGFVKHESFWDTRQIVSTDEGDNLLFPKPKKLDTNCSDINAKGQFEMTDITTQLTAFFDGPNIKHAKLDGLIRVDFLGQKDIVNILRMRHAYLTLSWKKAILLGGHTDMPFYIEACTPQTVSYNSGRPMETYARYPQLQVTASPIDSCTIVAAAMSQLYFESDGPIGLSSTYLRNAIAPMLQLRIDGHIEKHLFGVGAGFKRIAPRIESATGKKVREFISSGECIAFAAINCESIALRTKLIFAQNSSNISVIGGYAVHSVDTITDERTYTNFNTLAWWFDTDITHFQSVTPGLFIGVAKHLGSSNTILQNVTDSDGVITDQRVYGLGTDIDTVFRISPRIRWNISKFEFDVEAEYTRAAYGTLNNCGDVENTQPVANNRLIVTMCYYF